MSDALKMAVRMAEAEVHLPSAQRREWKRGVPEASGFYWYRRPGSVHSDICRIIHKDLAGDPAYAYIEARRCTGPLELSDVNPNWFANTEFCPLREKAPE